MALERVVVVGASLAGLRAGETLRREGFAGELTMVGAEPHPPYNRPPLSKQLLRGTFDADRCVFKQELEATWVLGRRATGLDLERREVLVDQEALAFDGLIVATGASPRPWPTALPELEGFHTLRELDDALALRATVADGNPVVVLGAGFIGCEVAATLRELGVEVTLVDLASHPMAPLGPELGQLCAEIHREHGVRLHLGVGVEAFAGSGRVEAVLLRDGTRVPAAAVLIAIGVTPNTGWLRGSGLTLEPGLVCDATCEAIGARDVFAAGDVARWPHPLAGGQLVRVEHWSNAAEQGSAAAANLLRPREARQPYAAVPSFWSDQYDVKIQSVGFPELGDRLTVVEGAVAERKFVAAYARAGETVGAVAFNMPRQLLAYRRALAERQGAGDPAAA